MLAHLGLQVHTIGQTVSDQLENTDFQNDGIHQSVTDELGKDQNARFEEDDQQLIAPEKILSKLSYTHIVHLIPIQDIAKRAFYELECIQQSWSVSELKRQINTLYYERSGISQKPEQLSKVVKQKAERLDPADLIKSPFTFEFLGLSAKDVVYENDLEKALLEHLENFLLEMGHGFCFEAKQKRILMFDDLERKEGDNPTIGLLLCTNTDRTIAKYSVLNESKQLFASKYLPYLPSFHRPFGGFWQGF